MKWVCTVSILVFLGQVYPAMSLPPQCQDLVLNSSYVGCFKDYKEDRVLKYFILITERLTPEYCIDECRERGFPFAGMEFGAECYCGSEKTILGDRMDETFCNVPCWGDHSKKCGADGIISVYTLNVCPEMSTPSYKQEDSYIGCFKDSAENRLLKEFVGFVDIPDQCIDRCREGGYPFAGVEFGAECFCGNANTNLEKSSEEMFCNMRCRGAKHKICGDDGMISVYSTNKGGTQCPVNSPSPAIIKFLPSNSYLGCFNDTGKIRLLQEYNETYPSLTPEYCIDLCSSKGYIFAGVAAGHECYCGKSDKILVDRLLDTSCKTPCGGNKNKTCGGKGTINVYSINDTVMSRNNEVTFNWWKHKDMFKDNLYQYSRSPFFYLNNYKLHMFLKSNENGSKVVGIFLYCDEVTNGGICEKKLTFNLSVIRNEGDPMSTSLTELFDDGGWGWTDFIDVEYLFNGGYIKNGFVHFQAVVRLVD